MSSAVPVLGHLLLYNNCHANQKYRRNLVAYTILPSFSDQFATVFQWCSSTPQGSPGVSRTTFLSSPHLYFIIVFICDLFVSREDPLMS